MSSSERIFRFLLGAYPKRIRDQQGADMWLTFRDHLRDARVRGRLAVLSLWRREVAAMLRDGRRARIAARKQSKAHHERYSAHAASRESLLGFSALDFKLGLRMLAKYPGLTVVGGLGMATAIGIGVGFFGFAGSYTDTALPFEDDDRVVSIQNWNIEENRAQRLIPYDIVTWRENAATLDDVGAAVQTRANLITDAGRIELVRLAHLSAAGFRLTRVPPLLGRTLLDADESFGAQPVVVLGFGIWRDVLSSDPDVVGRRIQIGNVQHTVVGVMPEGFAFPRNEELWTPLRLDPQRDERMDGPRLIAFGRLADNATIQDARSDLTSLAGQAAAVYPDTHEHVRPRVMAYTLPFVDMDDPQMFWIINVVRTVISLVLVVVCLNIAILVYARTAMRQREIGVRTALGASRRRVVTQLFIEALVLAIGATLVGVFGANVALEKIEAFQRDIQPLPFWMDLGLSGSSIVYAFCLTILAAVIVGVLPGLKATGRDVHTNLQRLGAGGPRSSLGGIWTFLIVTQVAIAVAGLPVAAYQVSSLVAARMSDPGFPASEVLTVGPIRGETWVSRKDEVDELFRRVQGDPLVRSATYSRYNICCLQGTRVDVERLASPTTGGASESAGRFVLRNDVGANFFNTLDVPLIGGRSFNSGDLQSGSVVIVNRSFALGILDGQDPLGRRIKYTRRTQAPDQEEGDSRWYEIVGVVNDFVQSPNFVNTPSVYHPLPPDQLSEGSFVVRIRGNDAGPVATRIRNIGAAVDPTMQIYVSSRAEALREDRRAVLGTALVAYIAIFSVVLLSSAGIYALMSFTVTQRRREIAIRTALGGLPRRILGGIFSRAVVQVAAGVLVGISLAAMLEIGSDGLLFSGHGWIVLPIAAVFMLFVGMLASFGPARRALNVQPTEVLKDAD